MWEWVCERQKSMVASCSSGKNALPPIPFLCNQNLGSPPALYHGLNSLDWHIYFLGEGQNWFHHLSGKPNSHLLSLHTAWEPQQSTGKFLYSDTEYRFLKETENLMTEETHLLPLFRDRRWFMGQGRVEGVSRICPPLEAEPRSCKAASLSWEPLLELEHWT